MTMFKRFAALMAVVMILAVTMVTPAFAAETFDNSSKGVSACQNGTNQAGDDSLNCQVAKAIGNGIEWQATKNSNDGFTYDVMVTLNGRSEQIWLKSRPEVDNFNVQMSDEGSLNVMGIGTGDSNQWNNLFSKYRTVVVGVSGVGAITMIVFFIINFMKLGSSAGNPQARSQALTGVLWTGLAAAGLGAVSIIAGFFYNAL